VCVIRVMLAYILLDDPIEVDFVGHGVADGALRAETLLEVVAEIVL